VLSVWVFWDWFLEMPCYKYLPAVFIIFSISRGCTIACCGGVGKRCGPQIVGLDNVPTCSTIFKPGFNKERKHCNTVVPTDFANFFAVMAGVGGTLFGLIFVVISIAPERTVVASAPMMRQVQAASAYTALLNPLIISLIVLIPHEQISTITLISGPFWKPLPFRHGEERKTAHRPYSPAHNG
jgi:hypothetical protein